MHGTQVNIVLTVVIVVYIDTTMSGVVDWIPLDSQFQRINKLFINLEDNEKRVFTEHFNKVYKHVTDSMGELDELFEKVFQRQQLAGSYADRIKVGQPNEYDALMILNFPNPVVEKTRPGFVKINIRDGIKMKWSAIEEQKYRTLIDEHGYLLQDKVLGWLRKLIYDVVLNSNKVLRIGSNEYIVKRHTSNGPAVTLDIIVKGTTGFFSIDFVGALAFDFKKKHFADFEPPFVSSKNWNAVAKPSKTVTNANREWTCSYADMEREYLHNTYTLKQLIRIFKKIRDRHSLTNLKSYYIKVIFLHQRKKQSNDYWEKSLGVLFKEMFEILLKALESRKLLSFWHKEFNLFGDLLEIQTTDIYNKLKKIKENINKSLIDKRPEFIRSVLLNEGELKELERHEKSGATNGKSVAKNGKSVATNGKSVATNVNSVSVSASATTSKDTCKANENKSCSIS